MRISFLLGSGASFTDGVIAGLLLATIVALIWATWSDKKSAASNFWAKFLDPLNIFTGVLAFATIALVNVSFLQWRTLDKTDQTFLAGERAFVFVTHKGDGWQHAEMRNGTILREFPIVWENAGSSPTKNLVVQLYCPQVQQFAIADPILLPSRPIRLDLTIEPKQTIWGGSCIYSNEQLKLVRDNGYHLYIATTADYLDIFDERHRTEERKHVLSLPKCLSILTI